MSARQYYYFVSGLPRLNMDDTKLAFTPREFLDQARTQLGAEDARLMRLLRLDGDLEFLLDAIYKQDSGGRPEGTYDRAWWDSYLDAAKQRRENRDKPIPEPYSEVPAWAAEIVIDALDREELPSRLTLKHSLLAGLYGAAEDDPNSFARDWFARERLTRNILLAINGRRHELDYGKWLIGEDDVTQRLRNSKAADFGIGKESELWEALNRAYENNNVLYRERSYDVLRWKWIDSRNFFHYFDIDKVLGYYLQLGILNRWTNLNADAGSEVFFDTLNRLQASFSFPAEFNIKQKNK